MSAERDENLHQLSCLVLNVGTYTLQKFFEKQYMHICELEKFLKCNSRAVSDLKEMDILQHKHVEILCPPGEQKPELEEMDITLLYTLLRYLCSIKGPMNGWDSAVPDSDKTNGADILRLKNMRHDLFGYRHRKPLMKEDYYRYWKLTFDAILRLSDDLNQTYILHIVKQVVHIVKVDMHEESRGRECRLCSMLCNGFKDDLKEVLVSLKKRYSSDSTQLARLKDLEDKLNDLHTKPDELFKVEEELSSFKATYEGQRNQHGCIVDTPKKSQPPKEYEEFTDVQRGPMETAHSNCIRRNIVQLKEELVCADILDNMIQERIFAEEDIYRINAAPTPKAKNGEFFSILEKRGPRAYHAFTNALRHRRYFGLVKKLEETLEQIQQRVQDSNKVSGNESQERMQQPHEDIEINQQMKKLGDVTMALLKPSARMEEEGIATKVSFDPIVPSVLPSENALASLKQLEHQRIMGFNEGGRRVSDKLPLGIVYPERKSKDSSPLEDPVRYGIPEVQDTSPKEIDAVVELDDSRKQLESLSVSLQGVGNKQDSRKNKNFELRKTPRNKNIHPGKPLENAKPESCKQFPTLKLCLPTEQQLMGKHLQTSQLEKKYMDPSEWVQSAQKKIDEATSERKDVEDFQTILCLDASYSMRGEAWAEAKCFIEDFIAGVESVRVDHGIIECVALTAFGMKTDIVQNLTTDLREIQRAFGSIIPDGPTQLYGGLYMALAAQGGYLPVTIHGIKHCPQVVLITDGRATHPHLVAGPDVQEQKDMEEINMAIMKVVREMAAKNICINCIPVGNANVSFLKRIASKAKGKTYDKNSGRLLAQRTCNTFHAAYLLQYWQEVNIQHLSAGGTDPISLEDIISKEFPGVNKDSGFKSFSKLPELEKAHVLAIAKDLVEFEFWQETVPSLSNFPRSERKQDGVTDRGQWHIVPYVSQVSEVSGDYTGSQGKVKGIPEGQFNQRHQLGTRNTEDGELIQKDLDLQSEERYENKGFWAEYAAIELEKAKSKGVGFINTVLCIDTSASMRGVEWTQVETFVKEFLSGLEDIRIGHEMTDDRVAIVVFGTRTQVLVGLTEDCSLLRQEFGKIKLGGPTPLYGGLMLALACHGAKMVPEIKGILMHPRIILITDGKPTVTDKVAGPDIFDPGSFSEINDEIRSLAETFQTVDIKVHCIPVGDADEHILRTITEISKGKMLTFKDGRRLARRTLHAQQVGPMLAKWRIRQKAAMLKGEELTPQDFFDRSECIPGVDAATRMPEEDKEGIEDILDECKGTEHRKRTPDEIMHTEISDSDLLPLGTRVQNEPVWHHDDEGCQGYGTVVGHIPHKKEIYVEWDTSGKVTKCRYGSMMLYDVSPVEVPRIRDEDQMIAVGCVVTRGPDWMYGDQDGVPFAKGGVIKVSDDGRVLVRWSNGSKGFYRYSQDNKYDLEIVG